MGREVNVSLKVPLVPAAQAGALGAVSSSQRLPKRPLSSFPAASIQKPGRLVLLPLMCDQALTQGLLLNSRTDQGAHTSLRPFKAMSMMMGWWWGGDPRTLELRVFIYAMNIGIWSTGSPFTHHSFIHSFMINSNMYQAPMR